MTPLMKFIISVICCIIVVSLFIFIGLYGIQTTLNNQAAAGQLGLATQQVMGMCPNYPTQWVQQQFTNGTYCLNQGVIGITDTNGNLIGAQLSATCPDPYVVQTINGNPYCVSTS